MQTLGAFVDQGALSSQELAFLTSSKADVTDRVVRGIQNMEVTTRVRYGLERPDLFLAWDEMMSMPLEVHGKWILCCGYYLVAI